MVASGRYGSASDVVMYALARLEDDEAVREARLARFTAKIDESLADIEAGRTHPAEEVFAELYKKIKVARGRQETAE